MKILVGISRSCDNCGQPQPDRDEILCAKCKARK